MKFELRNYQKKAADLLKISIINGKAKKTRFYPILCLPTGAGKTVTFSYIAEMAQKKGSKIAIICHRRELIEQAAETMESYGLNPLMLNFGMVQTFVRSPQKIPKMDICIIDECHIGNFRKFIDLLPQEVLVIGATATPVSSSNKTPLNTIFSDVVCPVQINELIKEGYLSAPVYHLWEVDESKLEKDFTGEFSEKSQAKVFHIDNLKEAYDRRVGKTIIFCSSILQAEKAKEALSDECFLVHSKMSTEQRKTVVTTFKASFDGTIINCGILTAGFDDPQITTVIIWRATTSMPLWLQMVGRGSRIIKNIKTKFYIFDMGNNTKRLLAWEVDRDWKTIFELQGKKISDKAAPMKKCVNCEAIIYASIRICPYCAELQPISTKESAKATKIKIIDDYSELPDELKKAEAKMSVEELVLRAQYGSPKLGRPLKVGWIVHQLKERENAKELLKKLANIKGYNSAWVARQLI